MLISIYQIFNKPVIIRDAENQMLKQPLATSNDMYTNFGREI